MFNSLRHAMSTRGGDAEATRARQHSPPADSYSPSLTDTETLGDDETKDRESDENEAFKREMCETFFGRGRIEELEARNDHQKTRIDDLTKRTAELKGEWINEYHRAQAEKERADKAEAALMLADPGELLATERKLAQAMQEKDAALASQEQLKAHMRKAKVKADDMRATLEANCLKLATDLEEAKNISVEHEETKMQRLRTMLRTQEAKIDQLVDKVDRLTAEKSAATESLGKLRNDVSRDSGDLTFYKSQNENLKYEMDELRSKLVRDEREIERLQHDNMRLLTQGADGYMNQQNKNSQDGRLASENIRLKAEIVVLNDKLNAHRSTMAYCMTQLDVNFNGWRLFNCDHANFREIPDGQNSTREVDSTHEIQLELLQDYVDDDKFIKEYNNYRRTLLQHHRAHERANQGRGVASFRIKSEFVKLDEKRGIPIKY